MTARPRLRLLGLAAALAASLALRSRLAADPPPEGPNGPPGGAASSENEYPRLPRSPLEIQIALARRNFSCGSLDGALGLHSAAALRAFQEAEGLEATGVVDDSTRDALTLASPPVKTTTVTAGDLARLQPLSPTWLGKSRQTALDYETALELVAERFHCTPALVRRLNPAVDWNSVPPGTPVVVPFPWAPHPGRKAARLLIRLAARSLEPLDEDDRILAHFPISIAAKVEKRPVGELHVTAVAPHPNYTVDPVNFPESAELREIGHRLILPPGPNSPVGSAWIGLDRTGYGMHGTPDPERIGHTESHGCFRMTNWDAEALIDYVTLGTPVDIEP